MNQVGSSCPQPQNPNVKHMKHIRHHTTPAVTIATIIGLGTVLAGYDCMNREASMTDELNSQCSTCLCINGNWTQWWLSSQTNACGGFKYGGYITRDIACGKAAAPYSESGIYTYVVVSQHWYSGVCVNGTCIGTLGPATNLVYALVHATLPCLLPCDSGEAQVMPNAATAR